MSTAASKSTKKKTTRSSSSKTVYVVVSFFSGRKECIDEDNVTAKWVSSTKEKARELMIKEARDIYGDEEDHYGAKTYFDEGMDMIDFGNSTDGYRSSRENWGFVKIQERIIDAETE
jgi:hypothetical protein